MSELPNNELAMAMQRSFPLCSRPYAEIGRTVGLSEDRVLEQVREWKSSGGLREISAVMEGAAIGYDSALVCGRIAPEALDRVANIISGHPTVTHNYERSHDYNLWFTIAVPLEMGLENHLKALEELTGAGPFHALRRTLTFKVGVVFDFNGGRNNTEAVQLPQGFPTVVIGKKDARILRALQTDLPVTAEPFAELAQAHDLTEDDLLGFAEAQWGRALRKYVATFRHRKMGIAANGMTVWNVAPADLPETGRRLAACSEVSHCYARGTCPDFPYTLYSMLHAPNQNELKRIAEKTAQTIGVNDYLVLHSPREYKKTRLRYFLPELDAWWDQHGVRAA